MSVIAFTPRYEGREIESLAAVAELLEFRLRTTDELGWLDRLTVCAILPGTGLEGACKVVEDVAVELASSNHPLLTTIYTHPSGGSRPLHFGSIHEESSPTPARVLGMSTLFIQPLPLWKRGLDIVGALFGLVLCLPLFLLVAAAIRLTSQGPVLFTQKRAGLGGKPFLIYKFRTMVTNAEDLKSGLQTKNEQDGPAFKMRNDPRLTWLGKLLRKTSIDELPQLWNVLKGDMTLVGPRPLPCPEAAKCDLWQQQRHDVTPGLTCIWQVRGRSQVPFAEWIRMDLQYIRSRSLAQDLKLLLLTIPAVVMRRGAC